jgi:dolichol-phosphate mannosyltransferase
MNDARGIPGSHKGLGQAIIDGISYANGQIVVVMDADLSHPTEALPRLVQPVLSGQKDFTVGSRYVKGGGTEGWTLKRKIISRVASLFALPVTSVKDATSGFFAFRKDLINGHNIEAASWKIMLEILVKTRTKRFQEIPITFKDRTAGKSKFNRKQMVAYLKHLFGLLLYKHKIVNFMVVGGIGYVINMGLYSLMTLGFKQEVTFLGQHFYLVPFIVSSLVAIFSNYQLNKIWTFRGWNEQSLGALRYLTMALVTLIFDMLILFILVDFGGLHPIPAAALAILIVFIARYVIAKRWVWQEKRA